jgi:starch synthase (maltosyl-transferring)
VNKNVKIAGPRILYLDARRAGPVADWNDGLERAARLGCDWIWLGDIQARAAHAHPFAVDKPGRLARELQSGEFSQFVGAAHTAGLKLATNCAPAFVARTSPLITKNPDWFVAGPDGTPAIPVGWGGNENVTSLAMCDFSGPARKALEKYWSGVAKTLLDYGFDALICRGAQRLSAESWKALLAAARRAYPPSGFWAEALGAPIEAAEALAPAGFDAFFSSACWWDFHADWFLDQERRLRRMAPTIALAVPPSEAKASPKELSFRYGFAATAAWGVVLDGTWDRKPPPIPPSSLREQRGERDSGVRAADARIIAVNGLKGRTPALSGPSRLRRLSAADARAAVLALEPVANEAPPVLIALNPDPAATAEIACGPLFAALDGRVAAAHELTPGHSPQKLEASSRIALEPRSVRWFELETAKSGGRGKAPRHERKLPKLDPIAIEAIVPRVEDGRFALKRVLGEAVEVGADLVAEGHGALAAALRYRPDGGKWHEAPFVHYDNDRWHGEFAPDRIGRWEYQVVAWRARFESWRADTIKRRDAGQALAVELKEGEALLDEAAASAKQTQADLAALQKRLAAHGEDVAARAELLLAETTLERIVAVLPRAAFGESSVFPLRVERGRARASAWYECFPRSLGAEGKHGTFDDLIRHLPYVAGLGFDVLYLPPIHPIGRVNRKGKNNALAAGNADPGSPWAIGAKEGGHEAIHPELGTLADFRRLLEAARREGLEIALDFAIQCAPDHPWVKAHPEWFQHRPDGSIRHAENPPKKYEDIVNVDFFCAEREALWRALRDVVLFWCGEGVRIFRVDNPHTKPLPFWEWLLDEVWAQYPDTLFLAEAFTRPKLMHRLAKLGFSQSYTYFVWRETKSELIEYMEELVADPATQYFRPNFWVNTPDINPFYLHEGARAGFVIRAVLAATLSPNWGLYSGYELCEHTPLRNADGTEREEYLDAEKYELKPRDFAAPGNIRAEIAKLNRICHDNPALAELANLSFHAAWNNRVLFYAKRAPDNLLWIIVSLDAHGAQEAEVELPLEMLGANETTPIRVEELFADEDWEWRGRYQRLILVPKRPAMILRVRKA